MKTILKLELTKKERKAVEDSITHWIEDIWMVLLLPLVSIEHDRYNNSSCFKVEGEPELFEIHDSSRYCPLCKMTKNDCNKCPYFRYYGFNCFRIESHWIKWNSNPSCKTAEDMIMALEKILEKY